MALTLVDGTVVPTSETFLARTDSSGRTTLPDGRVFVPAHLLPTQIPCAHCEDEGKRTVSGRTPNLAQREDDGFVGCVSHDGHRLTGMRMVSA